MPHYPQPQRLELLIDGRTYDVLSFDVGSARKLIAKPGFPGGIGRAGNRLEIPFHFPAREDTRLIAEVLQQQWLDYLGARVKLVSREFNVHWAMVLHSGYTGVAYYGSLPLYYDPNGFLDHFVSDTSGNPSAWLDTKFVSELRTANTVPDRTQRLTQLAACETRLLTAMPILPLFHDAYGFLCRPYIQGLRAHLFDIRAFKYAWIDTKWRSS